MTWAQMRLEGKTVQLLVGGERGGAVFIHLYLFVWFF